MSIEFPHIYGEILNDAHAKYQLELENKSLAIAKGMETARNEAAAKEEVKQQKKATLRVKKHQMEINLNKSEDIIESEGVEAASKIEETKKSSKLADANEGNTCEVQTLINLVAAQQSQNLDNQKLIQSLLMQ